MYKRQVYKDENDEYKFYGRFNQGVVTLNLVDVACSSGKDMKEFWRILDERLALCKEALMCRHNRLKGTPSDVAPILWQNGALARLKKGETIDKLLFNGYSTISLGYAGLCEMTRYMTGKPHTDPEATPFALEVMQYLNDACAKWKAEENIDFSLYGTPLESTTYKFSKCLQERFEMCIRDRYTFAGLQISNHQILIFVTSILLMIALQLIVKKTKIGKACLLYTSKAEMMPYTYTLAKEATNGLPMIRAMFLEYPNEGNAYNKRNTEYQYMYGDSFLVAPIYENQKSDENGNDVRNGIYLPDKNQIWICLLYTSRCV